VFLVVGVFHLFGSFGSFRLMSTSGNGFDLYNGKKPLSQLTSSVGGLSLSVAKRICRSEKVDYITGISAGDKRDYYVDYEEFRKAWEKVAKAKRKKAQDTTAANGAKRKAINKLVKAGMAHADAKAQVYAGNGSASPKA
tara:strand:- start:1563 stop:1979 length:417 start_codon:yes stop_codon:yes gene_type:complete